MNVGINGIFWGQERTGSGQYVRHLWDALQRLDATAIRPGDNQFRLLGFEAPALTFDNLDPTDLTLTRVPGWITQAGKNATKVWWEQAGLPASVQQFRATTPFDVLHYPYFAAPLRRVAAPTKLVVTVHDLIPLALPEYAPTLALKLYFKLAAAGVRRADLILADSEFSKRDIVRLLKVPPTRVQVVYLGVDSQKYRPEPLPAAEQAVLLRRLGLWGDERLIFYIGGFDKRKNIPLLLEAFRVALPRLRESEVADGGGRWTLALAGKPHTANSQMYPDLRASARAINETDPSRVRFLGAVSESDKALLYRAAQFFVFPSRYEGFGLDPLEALASGTPVICSDASSLPEVVGDAALLVNPNSPEAWRDAMLTMALQPQLRQDYAQRAPSQAAHFNWQKTAERTLELYNMLECFVTRGKAR